MPLKFGFGTEQKTYQYFDTIINKATPMEYEDIETIDGAAVLQVRAGHRADADRRRSRSPATSSGPPTPSVEAPEFYANTRTLWVEPVTGVIVKGVEQVRSRPCAAQTAPTSSP